jgi:ribosomal protein L37AE/L43A
VTRHASPFHCPYCGEQDLYPREDGWECRACLRAFSVTFLGQVPRPGGVTGHVPDHATGGTT